MRDAANMRRIATENLERVGLDAKILDLRPSELSGGMQKRVALARAIAPRPEIIFFDEPTTGLDPIRADVINDLIVELVEELGVTALTITHDMASARKIAHRVAMLYQGRIVWTGPRDRLYDSGNPYVDQFVQGRAEGPIT
jgi:phospholipid/cholesterol/gamma-HCH transport system ATP-binding protein